MTLKRMLVLLGAAISEGDQDRIYYYWIRAFNKVHKKRNQPQSSRSSEGK